MSRRFLIANPFGLGDAICSLSVAQRLRETHPDALIGFVGNERTADLLRLVTCIDHVYVFSRDSLRSALKKSPFLFYREVRELLRAIGDCKYDALIDFSLGREFSLAGLFLGIKRRVGFDYKDRGLFLTHKKKIRSYKDEPVAQQQLDLVFDAGMLPDNEIPRHIVTKISGELSVPTGVFKAPRIALVPGGGRSWGDNARFKQWDVERFAETALALKGVLPDTSFFLLGDSLEKKILKDLSQRLSPSVSVEICAGLPIAEVCSLIQSVQLVIGNDSGLMHLANMLGVKTVSIFGPVDEKVYGVYGGDASISRFVSEPVSCRPCYKDFKFPPCRHDRQCLIHLSVARVVSEAKNLLSIH